MTASQLAIASGTIKLSSPLHQHGGGGVYDLYCNQSPGGNTAVLASLFSCSLPLLLQLIFADI